MYLEDGKCAQCGKKLEPSASYTPHNLQLSEAAVACQFRPVFCSPRCLDAAADVYFFDDKTSDFDRLEIEIKTKYHPDLLQKQYEEAWYDQQHKMLLDPSRSPIKEHLKMLDHHIARKKQIGHEFYYKIKDAPANCDRELQELAKQRKQYHADQIQTALRQFFAEYSSARARYESTLPVPAPPPTITDQHRFEHTHILGPSGSGKTTLIQDLILKDLSRNAPAMVVIDPKGFMVEQVARLRSLPKDKVIYIDPLATPPLNLFKQRNRAVITQAIANFDYIFSQAGSPLTSKMRPVFKFCARLMFNIPDADIFLLMDFLDSQQGDPRFARYISALDDLGAKRFFEKDFYVIRRAILTP